jgi:DNA-binding CsgD family transcriptional regulator
MQQFLASLAEAAESCPDERAFSRFALEGLRKIVGFESGLVTPVPHQIDRLVTLDGDGPLMRRLYRKIAADPVRLVGGLRSRTEPFERGGYIDTELFTLAERNRMPFFSEITRPQGVRSQIAVGLTLRGRPMARLYLCRYDRGRVFQPSELERLRPVFPLLTLAHATVAASKAPEVDLNLSPREAQIARYLCEGFRNLNIAALLGTSPNTVRNQISRMYSKLGISSRLELVALLRPSLFDHPRRW